MFSTNFSTNYMFHFSWSIKYLKIWSCCSYSFIRCKLLTFDTAHISMASFTFIHFSLIFFSLQFTKKTYWLARQVHVKLKPTSRWLFSSYEMANMRCKECDKFNKKMNFYRNKNDKSSKHCLYRTLDIS